MKRPTYIFIAFLLTIGIPFAILNISLFKDINDVDSLAYMVGFLLITCSVIIGILQYRIETLQEDQKSLIKNQKENHTALQENINQLHLTIQEINEIYVYTADRDSVYDRLKYFVQVAKRRADLMYFGLQPPSSYLKSTNKDEYIETLDKVIDSKLKNIRRIILYTPENKDWIKSIVDKHKGNDRFSLSILINEHDLPLLSAQIIDDDIAILMNLDRSVTPNKPRDIIIESRKVCSLIEPYFQEMYRHSISILINGRINQENYHRYL